MTIDIFETLHQGETSPQWMAVIRHPDGNIAAASGRSTDRQAAVDDATNQLG